MTTTASETTPARAPGTVPALVGGLPSPLALCIAAVLFYRRTDFIAPFEIEPHVEWIKHRYSELRVRHPDGFMGAELQAMAEWVEHAIRTANAALRGGEAVPSNGVVGGMVTCRGCAGQFDDAECPHPHIDKRSCWHASKHPANGGGEGRGASPRTSPPPFAGGLTVEYGDRGHCPKCGRFCGRIVGTIRNDGLDEVTGICRTHGEVDLSDQDWSYEDFDAAEDHTANERSQP